MKAILTVLLLVGIGFSANAQLVTNVSARLKSKVVLIEAKSIGGAVMTSMSPSPAATAPGDEIKDTGTSPGHEYELGWKFVGRIGDKDVYHFTFTRMTKAGSSARTTTSKDVSFDGKQTTVFEDELHVVMIESPTEAELKVVAR
jgi:hypothetical protein